MQKLTHNLARSILTNDVDFIVGQVEGHSSDLLKTLAFASRSRYRCEALVCLTGVRIIAPPNKPKQRCRDIGELPLSDAAKLFEAREGLLGQWRVERLGDNPRSGTKRSSSPNALRRALRYAIQKYQAITHGHRRSR